MDDYKSILLKSPTPFVVVEFSEGNMIIRESNCAYKLYITEKYNLTVENFLATNILNPEKRRIEINKKIYNLRIEVIEENCFIVWFCEKECLPSYMQQKVLNVKKFDDVIFMISRGKIIFVNDSYESLFGETCKVPCDLEEGFYKFMEEKDKNIFNDYFQVIDKRIKIQTKEGIKWVWIRSNPIDNGDGIIASHVILTDITDRTNYVMNKKESREKFFSFVSHEIKNPVNMILATMQLIEKKVELDVYEEGILNHVDLVRKNLFRIMKIVNDLSSTSKVELGYLDFNPSNSNIVYFIEDICESVRDFVDINDMSVIFDTDVEELIVGFDTEKIEKIIINLVSNALKFRKKEGGFVLINLTHDDDFVYIKVKDNGIGISKENLNRIFTRYERLHDERSVIKEGTGLGLSLVESFARLHHGSVSVESEIGEWTEFTVKIANTLAHEDEDITHYYSDEERRQNIAVALSDL